MPGRRRLRPSSPLPPTGHPPTRRWPRKHFRALFARYRDSVFHVPEAQIELSTQLSDLQAKYDSVVKENETLKKSALLKPTARGSGATVSAAAPAPEDGKDATKDPSEQSTANNTENLVGPFIGSLLTVNGETCTISTEAKTIENQNYVRLFGLAPGSDLYVSLDGGEWASGFVVSKESSDRLSDHGSYTGTIDSFLNGMNIHPSVGPEEIRPYGGELAHLDGQSYSW